VLEHGGPGRSLGNVGQVRAADAAPLDGYQHLARTRFRFREVIDPKVGRAMYDNCLHEPALIVRSWLPAMVPGGRAGGSDLESMTLLCEKTVPAVKYSTCM
jgi:hypothetical protein